MLVLTRRPGESIRIGENIIITVLKIQPGQVKIGVQAPPDVAVHREEIFKRIQGTPGHEPPEGSGGGQPG